MSQGRSFDPGDVGALSRRELLAGAVSAALVAPLAGGCGAPPPALAPALAPARPAGRRRLRDLGIVIGTLPPGPWNAITDVPGVRVGHTTRIEGEGRLVPGKGPIRTGVTAIVPADDVYRAPVAAARFTLNGNGELTGLGNVDRSGLLDVPLLLTDTSNIGRVMNGATTWLLDAYPEIGDTAPVPMPVVGETWAGFLHDAEGRHLDDAHVLAALRGARSGAVVEGGVGGGTAMLAYGFKGGIGTSSRRLPGSHGGYTLGVLVQANHGRRLQLRIDGVPVGSEIKDLMPYEGRKTKSILIVGATDAPMLPHQLGQLCKRMALGLARTGAVSMHGSGDLLLFFSSGTRARRGQPVVDARIWNEEQMDLPIQAAVEATEEAVLNALCMAETMTGIDGNTAHALPLERLPEIFRKHGRPLSPERSR
ncbi:DmpA family aminopeptidase [Chondromyces apiculatus]|uniref:D-aminopeptidase n=1 Tax=Chondromyces apiculatus DSM 436 TaxID=1192034 RepID=A0A017T3N7_9BACT|nr:P1 family peptidase [Chondromyces apiculatus]EYF03869.1 D-aminopeptidase [Chondromyces apiculatus DSM 436]